MSTATVTDVLCEDPFVSKDNGEPFMELNTNSEACLIALKKCMEVIILAESPSQLWVNCPIDREARVSLVDLCPDLLLLDLPESYHILHEEVVVREGEDVLGRGGEGVVYQGVFRKQSVAIKQSDLMHMNCTRNLKLKKQGRVSLFNDAEVNGVKSNKKLFSADKASGNLEFESKSLDSFLDGDFYQFKVSHM